MSSVANFVRTGEGSTLESPRRRTETGWTGGLRLNHDWPTSFIGSRDPYWHHSRSGAHSGAHLACRGGERRARAFTAGGGQGVRRRNTVHHFIRDQITPAVFQSAPRLLQEGLSGAYC